MTFADPTGVMVSLLEDNWNNANTDSITPTFDKVYNHKRLDFTSTAKKTFILIMPLNPRTRAYNGSGYATKELEEPLKIDIRTMISEAHAWNCLQEAERILTAKTIQPHADYDQLDSHGNAELLHDRYKGLFHIQKNCSLIDSNTTTG